MADLPALAGLSAEMRRDHRIPFAIDLADLIQLVHARAHAAGQNLTGDQVADLRLGAGSVYHQFVGDALPAAGPPASAAAHATPLMHDALVRVIARQRDTGIASNAESASAAIALAQARFPAARVVAASGGLLLMETSRRMVPAVIRSILLSLPCIALLALVMLRSLRIACVAPVVAMLPLVIIYACLPVMGWPIDIAASMIACIALGIIMDETVHMAFALDRCRLGGTVPVPPVLLCACLAMSGSFIACMLGQFSYTRHFGILLAATFLIALAGNLTLAPALAGLWRCPTRLHNGAVPASHL